jgi:4-diphosphocytidyl-2-C-methyl-D-erythritol kinase
LHNESTAESTVVLSAPAKINLYLKVTGRRPDGFHCLETLMQKIDLADGIILRKRSGGIKLACPGSGLPEDERNIVHRAAGLFFATLSGRLADRQPGAEITLNKSIPVAAGLGGGSSDAGTTLLGLDQLYATSCTVDELLMMAVKLGADVPQFIVHWPAVWATGIGDELQPARSLEEWKILLVNPGMPVATGWVYEKFALTAGKNPNNLKNSQNESVTKEGGRPVFTQRPILPHELENDLEVVTAARYPVIHSLKERLLAGGASAAMMSGSGPTVFGLFPRSGEGRAEDCYAELKKEYGNTYLVDPRNPETGK